MTEKTDKTTILQVKGLKISFTQYTKGLRTKTVTPIKELNLSIKQGEIMGVVGASGSGKSLLAHHILGILPANASTSGSISYMGQELTQSLKKKLRGREFAFIPQSVNYLDPLMRVGSQVTLGLNKRRAAQKQAELFKHYELESGDAKLYPHELSGGMLRRVLFATSIKEGIRLVIADEPTPGIHPEVLERVLQQLKEFADRGAAVMLITHDIVSALTICDRITVLNKGETVETTEAANFSGKGERLSEEYTRGLWNALPQNSFRVSKEVEKWL